MDGDYATKNGCAKLPAFAAGGNLSGNWFYLVEREPRTKARGIIEAMTEGELKTALPRPRYGASRGCRWRMALRLGSFDRHAPTLF
ncbi:MAG: hypothetical protein L0Y50_06215 [Beijerinckiaceae bacterium]|nr:hypothetical protein [Beijerinckiaceae bacterium]MCI0735855.1 hypothetical protein [Beijerinckiaceae bacterium]